jgi:hypothetical protein
VANPEPFAQWRATLEPGVELGFKRGIVQLSHRRIIDLGGEASFLFDADQTIQRVDLASDAATSTGASKVYDEYLLDP